MDNSQFKHVACVFGPTRTAFIMYDMRNKHYIVSCSNQETSLICRLKEDAFMNAWSDANRPEVNQAELDAKLLTELNH